MKDWRRISAAITRLRYASCVCCRPIATAPLPLAAFVPPPGGSIRTETMWVVHFALGFTALYAAVITAMYFAQTWLLFPTALAGAAPVQPPTSTQYLEVKTHDGEKPRGHANPICGSEG